VIYKRRGTCRPSVAAIARSSALLALARRCVR